MNSLLSSGLLTASLLLGQTGEPPTGAKSTPAPVQQVQTQQPTTSRPIGGFFSDRPLISRITNWWKKDPKDTTPNFVNPPAREVPATPVSNPKPATTPSNDFYRKLPNPQSQGAKPT